MASTWSDITLGLVTIKQIQNVSHTTGAQFSDGFASGAIRPAVKYQGLTPHATSVTSTDLETILSLNASGFAMNGLANCSGTTPIVVPLRKRENCGTFASGSDHAAITSDRCIMTLSSLSGQSGQSATIDTEIQYLTTDSFVSPVTYVSGSALAAATFNAEFMLAGVYVNGVAVPELQSCTINSGITVTTKTSGGGVFLDQAFVTQAIPTISVVTEDADAALSVINAATSPLIEIRFQRRLDGGIVVPAATASHIKITSATGLRQLATLSGSSRDNAQGTISLFPSELITAVGVAL